ncbi:MAG: VWA domain-containing protein [Planctomycetes bacterium]|nr:VWA domain-containing protein [Planctomycetota bacterium]
MTHKNASRKRALCGCFGCGAFLILLMAATLWFAGGVLVTEDSELAQILAVQAPTKPGFAVGIVVDTSGSMGKPPAKGSGETKAAIAARALDSIVKQCEAWAAKHPGVPFEVGLYTFSKGVRTQLAMSAFEPSALREAIRKIPPPNGGTALGGALLVSGSQLGATAYQQRHLFVLTDGENTVGHDPASVASILDLNSEHTIRIHCVAFDTEAEQFEFLKEVGGKVHAADGADLDSVVDRVFGEILAEAPDDSPNAPGQPDEPQPPQPSSK